MYEEITKRIRASLIKSIEILDGRVPSEREMHDNLKQEILLEGGEQKTIFRWKKHIILKIGPLKDEAAGISGYLEEADLSHLDKTPPEEGQDRESFPGEEWKNL
jgi:hypothetical protein